METFLHFGIGNAVTATILAVFAAVAGRCCRRPAVRHALWLLVLLKLLTPPLAPVPVAWPRIEAIHPPRDEAIAPVFDSFSSEPTESIALPEDSPLPVEAPPTDSLAVSMAFADFAAPLLITAWLGGSFVWWSVALFRLRKFHRLLRQAAPAPADVQLQTQRLVDLLRLRHCPPVAFVSAPLSPLVWALGFTPRLLLPSSLWQRLDAEQRDTLLAHELAHLRRGDHWIRRLEFVVLGLYWWHPVVWWARRRLQEAEEECCDALVVSVLPDAASAYASALVETVSFLSQAPATALVGVSGAGQVPLLKRRLTMILTESRLRRPSRAAYWLIFGMGALLLPLAPGARTEPPKVDEPPKAPEKIPSDPFATPDRIEPPLGWRVSLLTDKEHYCGSCHQPASVNPHDLNRKPKSWQESHREAVRLMDQYTLLLRKSDRRPPAPDRSREDEIEKAEDEIEILKVQVLLKEAQLAAARTGFEAAERERKGMETLEKRGLVSERDRVAALNEVETQRSQIRVREAELKEPLVRLKQAERRLARLRQPAEKTERDRSQQEKRLRELEQKVEGLLKELRNLRHDIQPDKPRTP